VSAKGAPHDGQDTVKTLQTIIWCKRACVKQTTGRPFCRRPTSKKGRQEKCRYRTISELENSVVEINHVTNVTTVLNETTASDRVSRMNEACHTCMSYVTCERVMLHVNESCHMWMSHVTCEWVMSHVDELCHMWMRHVTRTWVVSHVNDSRAHMYLCACVCVCAANFILCMYIYIYSCVYVCSYLWILYIYKYAYIDICVRICVLCRIEYHAREKEREREKLFPVWFDFHWIWYTTFDLHSCTRRCEKSCVYVC